MNRKKLISSLVLTLVLLCGIAIGAGASGALQEIKAYLDPSITIKMEGEAQTFLDAKGNRVYPITYQGSTYLPVRAVAGLAGFEVNWDQATRTVDLGESKGVDLIDTYKAYQLDDTVWSWAKQVQTADGQNEDISGVSCSHWLSFGTYPSGAGDAAASFNLLGKHDTLTFSYFSSIDVTLTVLGDNGSVLGEYNIKGGAVAQTVTVPLLKTNELKFQVKMVDWDTQVRIFNAYLDAEK
ncbi:MAG: hypothetical protein HFF30_08665 [Flavonifractor sp.]|jgi:hypothetical protein|nr:hypothetical protein [Flavonifractor sp.]